MTELPWRKAIERVLSEAGEAMHYANIADAIRERELRQNFGATPQQTVVAVIATSIKEEGERSPFERVSRGEYRLRASAQTSSAWAAESDTDASRPPVENGHPLPASDDPAATTEIGGGAVRAFGILWQRDWVNWSGKRLEGRQLSGSDTIDFADQDGIYVLYDRDRAIYVGRTTKGGLFGRLKTRTTGRFATRWDRFSWFGFREPSDDGSLRPIATAFGIEAVIEAMEAVLIETLEPPQNRRRGDDFAGTEYDQVPDEVMEKQRVERLLMERLGLGR